MKNKMLGILVPVLAGAAVIGTGFSTWYFTNAASTAGENLAVSMAGYAEIGSLNIHGSNWKLSLDASKERDSGIHLTNDEGNKDVVELSYDVTRHEDVAVEKQLTLTTVVSIPKELQAYISATTTIKDTAHSWVDGDADSDPAWYIYTFTNTFDYDSSVSSMNVTYAFYWVEGREPTDVASWTALNTIVQNSSLKVTHTLDWAE